MNISENTCAERMIELVPYSPLWKEYFQKESKNLELVLKKNFLEAHHIGSTAIPSILAKPTLDILCVVHTLNGVQAFQYEFEKAGFIYKGSNGIPGRIYLVRYAKDGVTHLSHIHLFEKGNPLIFDHLDFRDYLNQEIEIASKYEQLKIELKEKYSHSPELYTAAKNEFIQTVLAQINNH